MDGMNTGTERGGMKKYSRALHWDAVRFPRPSGPGSLPSLLLSPSSISYLLKQTIWFFVIMFVCGEAPVLAVQEPPQVRVAVLKGKGEVVIAVSGPFEVLGGRGKNPLGAGYDLALSKVTPEPQGIKIGDKFYTSEAILIVPRRKTAVTVDKRRYRGHIGIFKDAVDGSLAVVNILDIESYVKGVLYHEISHHWPIEAIKAQAVACRTYALYQAEAMKEKDYDVTADTSSQVYGGYLSEKQKTNRAVNSTAGEILTYKGRVFPAYFHATCGGVTEKAGELWKIDAAPLDGGRVCSFCAHSPHYFWQTAFDVKDFLEKLGGKYASPSPIKNISVAERTVTGRVRFLELTDEEGAVFRLSAKELRNALGADVIRSTNFTVQWSEDYVVFSGKGWGHGVGLCQWGAFGMAREGVFYRDILFFYYPGAEISLIP